jgi:hypothetical protein
MGQPLSVVSSAVALIENTPQGENEWQSKDGASRLIAWTTTTLAPG